MKLTSIEDIRARRPELREEIEAEANELRAQIELHAVPERRGSSHDHGAGDPHVHDWRGPQRLKGRPIGPDD